METETQSGKREGPSSSGLKRSEGKASKPSFRFLSQFLGATFRALQHRNYRLYFFGLLISWIGTWMHRTAIGWLIYELTGSKMLLGLVAAATSGPIVLLSPWAGSLADRWSKRNLLMATQIWLAMLAFLLAGLVAGGWIRPWHLLLIGTLEGLAMALDTPTRQAFLVEVVGREDLANAVALNASMVNAARILGPSLAGILMASVGAATCFAVNGLSFIAVLVALIWMRLAARPQPVRKQGAWARLREGFRYTVRHPVLRDAMVLFVLVGIFGWSYAVLLPVYAQDVLHIAEKRYGLLLSTNGIGALFGALTVARFAVQLSPQRLRAMGITVFAVGLAALALLHQYGPVLFVLWAVGWGQMLFLSSTSTLIQTHVDETFRGRVMGIWTAVFAGVMPLGALLAGALCNWFGIQTVLWIGSGICLGVAGLAWTRRIITPPLLSGSDEKGSHLSTVE